MTRSSPSGDGSSVTFRSCWWARLLGNHPLVRRIDRIEAVVSAVIVATVILVLPFACAYGTSVHERSSSEYAQQSATHEVVATVTADSTPVLEPHQGLTLTRIRWSVDGEERNDVLSTFDEYRAGDEMTIQVDGRGNRTSGLVQREPLVEAIVAALSVWLSAAALGSAVILRMRRGFRRKRYAQWDRELQHLIRG